MSRSSAATPAGGDIDALQDRLRRDGAVLSV